MRYTCKLLAIVLLLIGGTLGLYVGWRLGFSAGFQADRQPPPARTETATEWTCPMHPQIRQPEFGRCDICFMDLVPLEAGSLDEPPRRLEMSESARALARIRTAPVERRVVSRQLRLVGKVVLDETRLSRVAARTPGRLDRLFVDYTGIAVRKGDHLAEIYSPELIMAQEELQQAMLRERSATSEGSRRTATMIRAAAEEKLRLWGLLPEQIRAISNGAEPSEHITLYAPGEGVVVGRSAEEGDYVKTGSPIYTIADLSSVWILLDAYESDLAWLRYGQTVEFTPESQPGEVSTASVSFISPVLDEKTRTVKVRLVAENASGRLKPGMFVRAVVQSRLGRGGRVIDPSLVGKWVSPMHPEVVKDAPGKCDVCGMDLVPAEELGLTAGDDPQPALVIPSTAPLLTGRRAVVYVRIPKKDHPTFEGRTVVLGPRAGNWYVVRDGLIEGEEVVVSGSFKIDSEMEIRQEPSMMRIPDGLEVPPSFRRELTPIYTAYLDLQIALAADDSAQALTAWHRMGATIDAIDPTPLDTRSRHVWDVFVGRFRDARIAPDEEPDIHAIRRKFDTASVVAISLVDAFGHVSATPLFEAYCPMAFNNRGAAWLQTDRELANPYFGSSMLRCGVIRRVLPAWEDDQ